MAQFIQVPELVPSYQPQHGKTIYERASDLVTINADQIISIRIFTDSKQFGAIVCLSNQEALHVALSPMEIVNLITAKKGFFST